MGLLKNHDSKIVPKCESYIQIVGIPMGTNCAPLVADLFLLCYERDFMLSLSDNNQTVLLKLLTQPPDI